MKDDPIVEGIRIERRAIEAECGNDPVRYAAHLREVERVYGTRLVSLGPKRTQSVFMVSEERSKYGK